MKTNLLVTLSAALLLSGGARAGDLRVGLKAEHATYLQFEPLNVILTVHNAGNEPFRFDADSEGAKSRLRFLVEHTRFEPLKPRDGAVFVWNLEVAPDETQHAMVDLTRHFDLQATGSYTIQALIEDGGKTFGSRKLAVNIVTGIEITSRARGIPGYTDRMRTYSLRYWPREKHEVLFLRVDEELASMNYGVFELGVLMRANKPVIKADRDGTVTIVHQSGTDHFTRTVFQSTASGVSFVDQTYHRANGTPYQVTPEPLKGE